MAVFTGRNKNSRAARTALKINYAVLEIINPAIGDQYPRGDYKVHHHVGIDTSQLYIARTGIRGANDLVWVGRAANYAAKLSARSGPATQITPDVYSKLNQDAKIGSDGRNMWTQQRAHEIGISAIFASDWYWEL